MSFYSLAGGKLGQYSHGDMQPKWLDAQRADGCTVKQPTGNLSSRHHPFPAIGAAGMQRRKPGMRVLVDSEKNHER